MAGLTGTECYAPVHQFSISDDIDTLLLKYVRVSECIALLALGFY